MKPIQSSIQRASVSSWWRAGTPTVINESFLRGKQKTYHVSKMTARGRPLRERWNGIKGMEIQGNIKGNGESKIHGWKELNGQVQKKEVVQGVLKGDSPCRYIDPCIGQTCQVRTLFLRKYLARSRLDGRWGRFPRKVQSTSLLAWLSKERARIQVGAFKVHMPGKAVRNIFIFLLHCP